MLHALTATRLLGWARSGGPSSPGCLNFPGQETGNRKATGEPTGQALQFTNSGIMSVQLSLGQRQTRKGNYLKLGMGFGR